MTPSEVIEKLKQMPPEQPIVVIIGGRKFRLTHLLIEDPKDPIVIQLTRAPRR